MRTFAARRLTGITVVLFLAVLLILGNEMLLLSLRPAAMHSGRLLFEMVIFLALYNLRKRLPFLPLGSSSTWLQLHIYVGLLAIVVFGLHISWRIPNGVFEASLAACFATVALSGVLGLIFSRVFARRLTVRGGEVLWDRIARLRGVLSRDVERLALACLSETESSAVVDFYMMRLRSFFAGPRNFWPHLFNSSQPREALLSDIDSQCRYLNDAEKEFMSQIAKRVEAKDDLDCQFALQSVLKYWLFVHIPLTYALLVFAVVHVVMVYAY